MEFLKKVGEAVHVRDPARWREGRVSGYDTGYVCFLMLKSIFPSSGGHFGARMGVWVLFFRLFEGIVSGN
jgi:hypothetical protein